MLGEDPNLETGVSEIRVRKKITDLNWQDLKFFGVAARAGSLRAAAALLKVQTSTISKRIEALESGLGRKLFDRGAQGLMLTRSGRQVADGTDEIEMILQETNARLAKSQDIDSEVRLLMSEGPANRWFMPHFHKLFAQRFPHISLRLGTTSEAEAVPPAGYDVYMSYAPSLQNGYSTVRIAKFHPIFLAARSYLKKFGTPKTVEDLAAHRFAEMAPSHGAERGFISAYADLDTYGRAALVSNSGLAIANAVQSGTAIGFLPSYIYLTGDDLLPILPEIHSENGVFLNFTPSAADRPEVRALIDFMKTVVFNKRTMPWFADQYIRPTQDWRARLAECMKEAAVFPRPSA